MCGDPGNLSDWCYYFKFISAVKLRDIFNRTSKKLSTSNICPSIKFFLQQIHYFTAAKPIDYQNYYNKYLENISHEIH